MERRAFGGTDKGLVRTNNQDRFSVGTISDTMCFGVVCDGMGGEKGGNIASDISVEFAQKALARDLSTEMTELSIRAVFSSIFSAANALVFDAANKDDNLKGMGTTMVLAVIKDDLLYIGTVGDSRAYLTNGVIEEQITKDHTVVQMMVDMGEITEEDAVCHPKRHFITRAVGVSDTVDMDFFVHPLGEGDVVLLCSDGFYGYFPTGGLYSLLKDSVADGSVDNLIQLALVGGGHDNVTTVVMY